MGAGFTRFLVRRFIFSVLAVLGATILVFALSRMAGDPRDLFAGTEGYAFTPEAWEMMGEELGLNRPLAFQYAIWLGKIVRGDWGQTLIGRVDVFSVIVEKIPATARLATVAWFFSTIIGIPLGVLSAVRRSTIWDYGGRAIALFGQATPSFWVGIMAILIFAVYLGWLPSGRSGDWKHFVLPTITLATEPLAGYLRLTRSAMLEILDSQYIVLARAKGVNSTSVVWKHALRNAIIPPLTVSGLLLAGLLDRLRYCRVCLCLAGGGQAGRAGRLGQRFSSPDWNRVTVHNCVRGALIYSGPHHTPWLTQESGTRRPIEMRQYTTPPLKLDVLPQAS